MPPKVKITKEMILNTVLDITREVGFEAVNARSIASKLQCSTRPIFTCYENMNELKNEFLAFAYEYYNQYVVNYRNSKSVSPYLLLPLSYIEFAQEETYLFKLLFINDLDLMMKEANDFYKEIDNEKKDKTFFGKHWNRVGMCKSNIFRFISLYSWHSCLNSNKKINIR